jgi:predicted DNA-binding transcriptional regulator YafY
MQRSPRSQRATPKVRRWTDLIAALLRHHYPVPFEQIAREVPSYAEEGKDPASVKRMFERDKKELLRFGVPLETAPDELGEPTLYTIRRTNFYLPYLLLVSPAPAAPRHGVADRHGYKALRSLAFEPDELSAVVAAAERVRGLGDPMLAEAAEGALRKLAFDLPVGAVARTADAPHVVRVRARPERAVFEALGDALRDRKLATFDYHAMGTDATERRTVEPYGLFYLHGHWYLAARDRHRDAVRNFRLSRMATVAVNTKRESTPDYKIPTSFDLREHARSRQAWELGDGDAVDVVVELARVTGAASAAAQLGAPVDGEPAKRLFVVRRVDAFARWLLSLGGDAIVVSPERVRDEIETQRRRTLEVYGRTAR